MPDVVDDPAFWRLLAEKARGLAATIDDEATRVTMMEIAILYDRLVLLAERRASSV